MARPTQPIAFICSCEKSMRPDIAAIGKANPGLEIRVADHLCRAETTKLEQALGENRPILIGCRQEAPLFRDLADDHAFRGEMTFVDIRNAAGWSTESRLAAPKMAALIAAAEEKAPPIPFVTYESQGVALVYGRDERAIDVARRLADRLDLTVLLTKPGPVAPPLLGDIPIHRGTIRAAKGHLGAFELTVDDFASPSPSSRAELVFGAPRDGARSKADIVIDLTGGRPLFTASDLRYGYLRADPDDAAAVANLVFEAAGLSGTFDKPRYVTFTAGLCAHSRSKKTGCTRCLDVCPTGAIAPAGDHVTIDPHVCAGCGACAAVCPTGATAYALPPADSLMRKLRRLVSTYLEAGGETPIVLFHDETHGAPLIDALARHGDGLPAHVLPLEVNEITQIGPEMHAAALAFGACHVAVLARAKPRHDIEAARRALGLTQALAGALGYGSATSLVETDDPQALLTALSAKPRDVAARERAGFLPLGDARTITRAALRALHECAPAPQSIVALPQKAPYGRVDIRAEGCTLCLACVSACPANALLDNPEKPQLRFLEEACVQCGLCATTCPEKVIRLEPRMNFEALGAEPVLVKEEEPFHCIRCGTPFGVKSTVERIAATLKDKHWMFAGGDSQRIDLVRMCDTCRVAVVTDRGLDPYAGAPRPKPRTAEDYRKAGDDDAAS